MERKYLSKMAINLIKELYVLEMPLTKVKLQNINIEKDIIIIKDSNSEVEECFDMLDIGQFINYKNDELFEKNINLDKIITDKIKKIEINISEISRKRWITEIGELLYIKTKKEYIKKELILIEKKYKKDSENYNGREKNIKKFNIDIEKLIDLIYEEKLFINNGNIAFCKLNGKIIKLGQDKEKIKEQIKWLKERKNIEAEIITRIPKNLGLCVENLNDFKCNQQLRIYFISGVAKIK